MHVANSNSAAMIELYQKNPDISAKALKESGIDIGKDIMGTMTNILFFAYVSGSIPMLILYLKNHSPLGFTLSINLSLEFARALSGGIGIVITRSEEHTSELQSRGHLVCRLLLEKKNN